MPRRINGRDIRCLIVSSIFAAVATLVACKTTELSVREAEQVLLELENQPFTMPPRTIDDVRAVLDSFKPDSAELRRFADAADREIDDDTPAGAAWVAYWRRSRAAYQAGRPRQATLDLRKAFSLADHVSPRQGRRDLMRELALAEVELGNFESAKWVMKMALREMSNSVGNSEVMARVQAASGDLDKAQNYASRALRLLAKPSASDPPQEFRESTVRYVLAEAEGNWRSAERYIRESINEYEGSDRKAGIPNWIEKRKLHLARNLERQGRLAEAEAVARDALAALLARVGKYNLDSANAISVIGVILMSAGRFDEAEVMLDIALEIFDVLRVPRYSIIRGQTMYWLAVSQLVQGKWTLSSESFEASRVSLSNSSYHVAKLHSSSVDESLAALRAGSLDHAEELIQRVAATQENRLEPSSEIKVAAGGVGALIELERGDLAAAVAAFREIHDSLANTPPATGSQTTIDNWRRRQFLAGHVDALQRKWNGGDEDASYEAFRLVPLIQSSSVSGALNASTARSMARSPDMRQLLRKEQDASHRIRALDEHLQTLAAAPLGQADPGVISDLRNRIERLREAHTTLVGEIVSRFPEYGEVFNPPQMGIEEVRKLLRGGEALVVFHVRENDTLVWAVPKVGTPAFAVSDIGSLRLQQLVTGVRYALDPGTVQYLADIPRFDLEAAYRLFHKLLLPVSRGWRSADNLLFVLDGPLGQLPPSVLVTTGDRPGSAAGTPFAEYREVDWLVRTHAVTILPSVSSLRSLRSAKRTSRSSVNRPFVGFADPFFSTAQAKAATDPSPGSLVLRKSLQADTANETDLSRLPRLPETADELTVIARSLGADPSSDVFVGVDATETRVKTMDLSRFNVVAFATHGLRAGDLAGLRQPALALTSPVVSKTDGDGVLTMDEIFGLNLDADWVLLSACNSAAADGRGAEAISGLGRAFFYAGARALLVSNWPVETTSTKDLTTEIFRAQPLGSTVSRAEALRLAQLALIDERGYVDTHNRTLFSYAHPIFWAPFTLIGDPGTMQPE